MFAFVDNLSRHSSGRLEHINSRLVVFSWSCVLPSVAAKRAYVRTDHLGNLMEGIPGLSCFDRHLLFSLSPTLCLNLDGRCVFGLRVESSLYVLAPRAFDSAL
jgi:hypothetical protein